MIWTHSRLCWLFDTPAGGVCVLHLNRSFPVLLPVDIQHIPCPCRFFILLIEGYKLSVVTNFGLCTRRFAPRAASAARYARSQRRLRTEQNAKLNLTERSTVLGAN